jgi:methylphosphotriester-DNA--protein-cysteine methyltransferase
MTAPLTPPLGTYAPKLRPVLVMEPALHPLFHDIPAPYVAVTDTGWSDLHGDLVRSPPAIVVVVDPHTSGFPRVHELLRRFPSVPVVAAAELHPADAAILLEWGVSEILSPRLERTAAAAARRLDQVHARPLKRELQRALSRYVADEAWTILHAAAEVAVEGGLAPELAERLGVSLRTLSGRFARAGLPAPRQLQAWMRVLLAALLLDDPGRTLYGAAYAAGYRTERSLRRAITAMLGMDGTTLRRAGAFRTAAAAFDRVAWEAREAERERRKKPARR